MSRLLLNALAWTFADQLFGVIIVYAVGCDAV